MLLVVQFGMTPISSFALVPMEEDKLRDLIVPYLVESGFTSRHMETKGFKELVNGLEPRFKIPCHVTVQRDCIKLYMEEKL